MADFTTAIQISLVGLTVVFVSLGLLMIAIQTIGYAVSRFSLKGKEGKADSQVK